MSREFMCVSARIRVTAITLLVTTLSVCAESCALDKQSDSALGSAVSQLALDELLRPVLHVSPDGRDEWSGKLAEPNADRTDGPLASIQAARDKLRKMRASGEELPEVVIVRVHAGTYLLDEPLAFGPEDAGKGQAQVVFMGPEDGQAVLSGGRPITGWREVEVNGLKCWAAELPEVKQGQWSFRQLFVNGQRRPRARLPKQGFYRFAGLPQTRPDTPWTQGQDQASFEPGQIRNWRNLADIELVVLHFWVAPRMRIAAVDEAAHLVRLAKPSGLRMTDSFHTDRFAKYYVDNVFEAMTEPGEWYLDRPGGTLYYLPLPGEKPENVTVIAPRLSQLVRVVGEPKHGQPVQHLVFHNLSFQHAEWYDAEKNAGGGQASVGVPGAVYFENARACALSNSEVAHVSNYAVEVGEGCQGIMIDNNELTDLGAGGVKIGHGSNATTFTNNEVGPGGLIFHSAVGVWIGHSNDNIVTHNDIHHLYYTGVSVGWTWGYAASQAARNAIEYNHIHHIGQGWLSDMGGIYTLGVSPGTRLRYNLIHDVEADNYGGWGLYNDEGSTDILLENNIVYRTTHGGYHQHYGRENMIRNNIFAFGRDAQIMRTRHEEHISFLFFRNIVYFSTPTLLGGNWQQDRYLMDENLYFRVAETHVPEGASATNTAGEATATSIPSGTGGAAFNFAGGSLEDWRKRGHDLRSLIADPLFEDAEHGDFRLKPNSPALKIGFQPIDTSQIGRRKRP